MLAVRYDIYIYIYIYMSLGGKGLISTQIHANKKYNSTPLDTMYNLCLPQITHTYGCTLQFVLLRMGANSTRHM
jgi:hypothetical protein